MRWSQFAGSLEADFTPRINTPAGTILLPATPFDVYDALLEVAENEDDRDHLVGDVGEYGGLQAVQERWQGGSLMTFLWDSLSGLSSYSGLRLLQISETRVYVCFSGDDQRDVIIAALEATHGAALFGQFFVALMEDNGAKFGIQLFLDLPSHTVNYGPKLLAASVVKEAYWNWIGWATSTGSVSWATFREGLIDVLVEDPLQPVAD